MKDIVEAVREQAKEEGRQEERAAIVAWLRHIGLTSTAMAVEQERHLK